MKLDFELQIFKWFLRLVNPTEHLLVNKAVLTGLFLKMVIRNHNLNCCDLSHLKREKNIFQSHNISRHLR